MNNIPNRWETHQRLRFIEARLYWAGRINRGEIIEHFRVSQPQASKDLTMYQEVAPGNTVYDKSAKTYRPSDNFKAVLYKPSVDQFDGHLLLDDGVIRYLPEMVRMPIPLRQVNPDILRRLLIAVRESQSIRVSYQSMTRPKPVWRWVTPHAFAHDGFRWHVRAYCETREAFLDFVISRIQKVGDTKEAFASGDNDTDWNKLIDVQFISHPDLQDQQRKIIEHDYGMRRGLGTLKVQKALLLYVLVHLGLDTDNRPAKTQHIVLKNKEIRELVGL